MTIEQRLSNLENLVHALSKKIDNNKFYTDADVSGTRASVDNITPYRETKKGYVGEVEKVFYDAPDGNLSVFFDNYNGPYATDRVSNRLTVSFDALTEATDITISIQ